MNKRAARTKALEGNLSIGDLRQMITSAKDSSKAMSAVNPAIPLPKALEIYEAALAGQEDDHVPKVWRLDPYSRKGHMKPTGMALTITNILRDCA